MCVFVALTVCIGSTGHYGIAVLNTCTLYTVALVHKRRNIP